MAIGKASDFKIYNDEFFGGMTEVLRQNTEAFNSASRGGIRLISNTLRGEYEKESFMQKISGLVSRQDITSVAAPGDLALTQEENVNVKVHRKIGPVAQALKAFKMINENPRTFSFVFGQQAAKDVIADMLNTGLASVAAALSGTAALTNDVTGATTKSITHSNLLATLAKFGDASNDIVAWVLHSTQWFDLGQAAISDQIDGIAGAVITSYVVPGFTRPFIVTDSPSLIVTGDTPDSYYVLGLTEGGLSLVQSEEQQIESEMVTGLEQLVMRIQGEYAYNIGVKGFTWDVGNGGPNPVLADLSDSAHWDGTATSDKDKAGVILKCQAAA